MTITYFEFTQVIAQNEGEILATTAQRAMFRAAVAGNGVRFTPVSSRKTRKVNEAGTRQPGCLCPLIRGTFNPSELQCLNGRRSRDEFDHWGFPARPRFDTKMLLGRDLFQRPFHQST